MSREVNPAESRLAPFLAPLRAEVIAAARRWLDLPGALDVALLPGAGLRLRLGWPGRFRLPVEIDRSAERRPGALTGRGARITLGRPEGGEQAGQQAGQHRPTDPALAALVARMERRIDSDPAALWAAWEACRPFAGLDDRSFRRLGPSTEGLLGQLRTGFRCSQDCGFCWQDRRWPEAPEGWIDRWLEQMLEPPAARVITFTGGEPTLHPALPRWIARARAGGAAVSVQTNALRLRHPSYVETLVQAGLSHLLVSLHSHDPATSDRLTRAPGTWKHTVAGICAALRAGLQVALNLVVTRDNLARLPDYSRFVMDTFVRPFPDNPVRVQNFSHPAAAWEAGQTDILPLDEARGPLTEAIRVLYGHMEIHAAGSCGFPPCLLRDLPEDLQRDRSMADAGDLSARIYGEACGGCSARDRCPGLRREYLERFGERGVQAL